MSDGCDPQAAAQGALDCAADVSAEFGWMIECQQSVEAAKFLYQSYGPFELDWPYGITQPDWYDPREDDDE